MHFFSDSKGPFISAIRRRTLPLIFLSDFIGTETKKNDEN